MCFLRFVERFFGACALETFVFVTPLTFILNVVYLLTFKSKLTKKSNIIEIYTDSESVWFKMRFIEQAIRIPVRNLDESPSMKKLKTRKHSDLLPNSIRCIIAGPSNCGKTNLLISLIECKHGLKFENIYIYSRTLEQEKYSYLKNVLKPISGVGFFTFSSSDEVIAPNEARKNSIIVFDDVICDKNQENIKSFYCLGRHRNIDCFYLTQTYARISKHLIRDNCNFLILFRQDDVNLKHVYNDMGVASDMKFNKFQKFCFECWREKYGFVVIDLDSDVSNGRYRKGFSNYLRI